MGRGVSKWAGKNGKSTGYLSRVREATPKPTASGKRV